MHRADFSFIRCHSVSHGLTRIRRHFVAYFCLHRGQFDGKDCRTASSILGQNQRPKSSLKNICHTKSRQRFLERYLRMRLASQLSAELTEACGSQKSVSSVVNGVPQRSFRLTKVSLAAANLPDLGRQDLVLVFEVLGSLLA